MAIYENRILRDLRDQKRIFDILFDLGVDQPLKALNMMKRKIAAGRLSEITIERLLEWGKS